MNFIKQKKENIKHDDKSVNESSNEPINKSANESTETSIEKMIEESINPIKENKSKRAENINESNINESNINESNINESQVIARVKPEYLADPWILFTAGTLILLGLLMVTSASYANAIQQNQSGYYYGFRQALYIFVGLVAGLFVFSTPTHKIEKATPYLMSIVTILLILVVIPGIGRSVNGAMRWLPLGIINVQPAELAKITAIIYISSYLKRHFQYLSNSSYVLISPLIILSIGGVLLLLQPDFGSTAVILMVCLTMLFMGGVSLIRFSIFGALSLAIMASLIMTSSYRLARLVAFSNPWADPLNKGFQLIQSLIAIGRGEVYGQGIGASIQKLGYLPEAHTDFIFAVYAEETGIIGVIFLILLFLLFFWRCLYIGHRAYQNQHLFPCFAAYGIGLWFILQSFINFAVVMGSIPTKGLTLPLVSYGGSSIIVMMATIGFLLRIEKDTRIMAKTPIPAKATRKKTISIKNSPRPNRPTPKGLFRLIRVIRSLRKNNTRYQKQT